MRTSTILKLAPGLVFAFFVIWGVLAIGRSVWGWNKTPTPTTSAYEQVRQKVVHKQAEMSAAEKIKKLEEKADLLIKQHAEAAGIGEKAEIARELAAIYQEQMLETVAEARAQAHLSEVRGKLDAIRSCSGDLNCIDKVQKGGIALAPAPAAAVSTSPPVVEHRHSGEVKLVAPTPADSTASPVPPAAKKPVAKKSSSPQAQKNTGQRINVAHASPCVRRPPSWGAQVWPDECK
jgi:hypothetical protein